jgi:hypothetical protein
MSTRSAAVRDLRAAIDALPLHPSPERWRAFADACLRAYRYAAERVGDVEPCPAVGPGARGCILVAGHAGRHVDARGRPFD